MKYIIHILFLIVSFGAFGQSNPLSSALRLYQEGQLEEAKQLIDSALQEEVNQSQMVAYYIKGFIYKDIFKNNPTAANKNLRAQAIQCFFQVIRMDEEGRYLAETKQSIKYLTSTYYNDAMVMIQAERFEDAINSYYKFDSLAEILPDSSLVTDSARDQFYLALGIGYADEDVQQKGSVYFDKAENAFKIVLANDSLNEVANYSLGVLYYNEAVNRILELNFDEELDEFDKFEDDTIELFKKALPYMQNAYEQDPEDENVIEGLAGIHHGLRDFDNYERYMKELKALRKDG
ncbi:tetratricopeptide repeat protein [Fulvivirga sediminis]|uniref:Tetratricopeptide repeat protein n=1 Tax=Fulvivirga sediminis TaxID=2803949 RepID=A0A937F579_9BACT|nr:hypothetical protein [Fulvivirga sediminis]MBL3656642.1 hypothetical protein [Fulvivirga sediminis]